MRNVKVESWGSDISSDIVQNTSYLHPNPLPEGEGVLIPLPPGEGRVRVSLGMSELTSELQGESWRVRFSSSPGN